MIVKILLLDIIVKEFFFFFFSLIPTRQQLPNSTQFNKFLYHCKFEHNPHAINISYFANSIQFNN